MTSRSMRSSSPAGRPSAASSARSRSSGAAGRGWPPATGKRWRGARPWDIRAARCVLPAAICLPFESLGQCLSALPGVACPAPIWSPLQSLGQRWPLPVSLLHQPAWLPHIGGSSTPLTPTRFSQRARCSIEQIHCWRGVGSVTVRVACSR